MDVGEKAQRDRNQFFNHRYMKTHLSTLFVSAFLLTACSSASVDEPTADSPISIHALIRQVQQGRASVSNEGVCSFTTNDHIGFFNADGTLSKWTYNGTSWETATPQKWKDKSSLHTFYAFAPYVDNVTLTSVSMPVLKSQTGDLTGINAYDFLTAKASVSFSTADGKVNFTEANALQHRNSLLTLIIKKTNETDAVTLDQLVLSGTDIASTSTYNLSTQETTISEHVSSITASPSTSISAEGYSSTFMIRPIDTDVKVSITYTKDNVACKAEGTITKDLLAGVWNQFTFRISQGVLTLVGNSIANWTREITADEIQINEVVNDVTTK